MAYILAGPPATGEAFYDREDLVELLWKVMVVIVLTIDDIDERGNWQ